MSEPEASAAELSSDFKVAEPVAATPLTPGARFAEQRHALGWSVEQVAAQLNLAPRQIQAIEEQNFAALPGLVSARGFIRSYAKLLRLDAEPLLALTAVGSPASIEPVPMRRVISEPFAEARPRSTARSKRSLAVFNWLLLFGLMAGLVWALATRGWIDSWSHLAMTVAPKKIAPPAAAKPASSVALTATETALAATAGNGAAVNDVSSSPVPPASGSPEPAPTSASAAGVVNAVASITPAVDAAITPPRSLLVLTLRQDSWIDLKDASGRTLAARLAKAGSSETFEINEALVLTIGNAAGVDATLRGQPLDLTASKNNIARLTLQ